MSELADESGTYTIDGWPPSGSQHQAYASTWSYNTEAGGSQVISVINVQTLIANGDQAQSPHGFHFKLEFSQDPQKQKVFWVNCPGPTPTAAPTDTPTAAPTGSPTGGVQGITTTPTPGSGTGSARPTPTGAVQGITTPATGSGSASNIAWLGLVFATLGIGLLVFGRRRSGVDLS